METPNNSTGEHISPLELENELYDRLICENDPEGIIGIVVDGFLKSYTSRPALSENDVQNVADIMKHIADEGVLTWASLGNEEPTLLAQAVYRGIEIMATEKAFSTDSTEGLVDESEYSDVIDQVNTEAHDALTETLQDLTSEETQMSEAYNTLVSVIATMVMQREELAGIFTLASITEDELVHIAQTLTDMLGDPEMTDTILPLHRDDRYLYTIKTIALGVIELAAA